MNEFRGLWRGKRVDNNGWVCGVPLQHCDGDWQLISGKVGAMIIDTIIPSTLGECTGLRDKNEKLIFEGDFVKHYCYKDDPTRFDIGVIFWEKECARFKRTSNNGDTYFIAYDEAYPYEVIANIHDNPELLKGEY